MGEGRAAGTGRGRLIVLSGPSGAGKTTIARRLVAAAPDEVGFSVSATTRPPRPGERDGVDYHFWSRERFAAGLANDEFLEHAQVYGGQAYGTLRAEVERELAAGRDVLLDIDVQGGRQVRARCPEARLIFILPGQARSDPETWKAALRERLKRRGTEDPTEIERRLSYMLAELAEQEHYDHVVINDDLDRAAAEVERLRRAARATGPAKSHGRH